MTALQKRKRKEFLIVASMDCGINGIQLRRKSSYKHSAIAFWDTYIDSAIKFSRQRQQKEFPSLSSRENSSAPESKNHTVWPTISEQVFLSFGRTIFYPSNPYKYVINFWLTCYSQQNINWSSFVNIWHIKTVPYTIFWTIVHACMPQSSLTLNYIILHTD